MESALAQASEAVTKIGPAFRVLHVTGDAGQVSQVRVQLPPEMAPMPCASLTEALSQIQQRRPDGILLDLNLPDSKGWEAVAKIRAAAAEAAIIVLAEDAAAGEALAAREGAQDCIRPTLLQVEGLLSKLLRYAIQRMRDQVRLAKTLDYGLKREQEMQDITEHLKRTQLSLAESEKMQTIGQLAAGIAHEVKNPLAVIRMGLDYLRRRLPSNEPSVQQVLENSFTAIRRADSIITELLDYAAPKPLIFQEQSLNQPVSEAAMFVRHEANKRGVTVTLDLANDLPLLYLNVNKMTQVFVNLILNAVQAVPKGGSVLCRTSCPLVQDFARTIRDDIPDASMIEARMVVGEIIDSGPGIPPELINRIFEPFFTTKENKQGTGLGLSITRMIVEIHGGGMSIRNRPEGGAHVSVYFLV